MSDPASGPQSGPVSMPHTWRPIGVRIVGIVSGFGLLAICIATWVLLGPDIRAKFDAFQRITMVVLGFLGAGVWHALIRARVDADEDGVTVVNGYKRRSLAWEEIIAVRLRNGAPWAEMDLADGTEIPVMAFQGSDGDRAVAMVRELKAMVAAHEAR